MNTNHAITSPKAGQIKDKLWGAMRPWLASMDWRTLAAFGLPFALYLLTLAPTIYNLDSAELTTAAATGGIVRATGYPLYLLLGYFWSRLPIGDMGYRMNLFSAFNGALTVLLADRILRRWRIGPWATFGALGLLACATFFWALSLIAEVYTLHTALMAVLILLLLRWGDNPTPRRLALVGFVMGASLGHHAATVLLIPGSMWYVLTVAPRKVLAPRALLLAAGAVLLGLSVYLVLPLRYASSPAFNYAGYYDATGTFKPVNLQTLSGLWWLVSGRAFARQMLAYSGNDLWSQVGQYWAYLWREFFAIGIGPGLLGLVFLLRRNWRVGGMLLLMFIGNVAFYTGYRVTDKDTMFLPTDLIWALWLGVGYRELITWMRDARDELTRRWGLRLLHSAIIGFVLVTAAWNWKLVNLSHDWSARERGETILREVEPGALILGWWDTVPIVEYLQLAESQRPDVWALNRFLIGQDELRLLILQEVERRPVYIDSPPTSLPATLEARSVGLLYRLRPKTDLSKTAEGNNEIVSQAK
jgi:hypothetical protein